VVDKMTMEPFRIPVSSARVSSSLESANW
jgi:hypothetical protein